MRYMPKSRSMGSEVVDRPEAVKLFERAGLSAVVLDVVHQGLLWRERVAVDGERLASAFTFAVPLLVAGVVVLVSRGRRGWARWLYVVLVGLTLLAAFRAGFGYWVDKPPHVLAALVAGLGSLVGSVTAVAAVLSRSASRWVDRRATASKPAT